MAVKQVVKPGITPKYRPKMMLTVTKWMPGSRKSQLAVHSGDY